MEYQMDLFQAIKELQEDKIILIDKNGHEYQRYSKDMIWRTYSKNSEEFKTGSLGGTIKNQEFLEQNINNLFEISEQWYQRAFKLPILCKVKENGWSGYKIVSLNYYNGTTFNTGFSESYFLNHRTEIIPLTNKEIKEFLNPFKKEE